MDYCQKIFDENKNLTVDGFAKKVVMDDEAGISWVAWILETFGKKLTKEVRKKFLKEIKDPMLAFQFYLKMEFLTDEEDILLVERFKGKLPQAEMELRTGIVRRRKV